MPARREPDGLLPGASGPPRRVRHVVGIGASAGGLEALRRMFRCMPTDTGIAFVVVVHLSPEHESYLAELLRPFCPLPVQQVKGPMPLAPDTVFVIPPDANLESVDSELRLSPLEGRRRERAPIDRFLRTLATTHDGHAVAVILSGGGADGAIGLRHVREGGGFVVVQDPAEAIADSMPRHAIASGLADRVAPSNEIAAAIVGFCNTEPRLPTVDGDDGLPAGDEELLERIVDEVRQKARQDVGVFQRAVLLRWLGRRMRVRGVETLADYVALLRRLPAEARALHEELQSHVVAFFGDAATYTRLEREVVPRLLAGERAGRDGVRAWTIGCSTGEDAWSLAILLLEAADRTPPPPPTVRVFASERSAASLERARQGLCFDEAAARLPEERLRRWFQRDGDRFRVRREVRDVVVFARHDLLRDAPFPDIDLIVCRHFLRDLRAAARAKALALLAHALVPGGFLVVGDGEVIDAPQLFERLEDSATIYRRRVGARAPMADGDLPRGSEPSRRGVHARLLEHHGPPSVLLDERHRVLHYSPNVGTYVHLPGGTPTDAILELLPESLANALQRGFAYVATEARPWRSEPLVVETPAGPRRVRLRLVQDEARPSDAPAQLLLFEELELQPVAGQALLRGRTSGPPMARLEQELGSARQRVEELLAAPGADAEALRERAAAVSGQLAAAHRAVRATRDELATLDAEHRRRQEELSDVSRDLQHLLASTGVAKVFLDRQLAILRFTPPARELFGLRESDRGRPFAAIEHGLHYTEFQRDAEQVLADAEPLEREVDACRRTFLVRILPYEDDVGAVLGVVLSLVDITDRKRTEDALRIADRRKDEFLATLGHELRNPLAPISTGIGVLRAAGGDPRVVAEISEIMDRQARQLGRLVDDLLDVARITSGRLQLAKQLVDLVGLVRDAVDAVGTELNARGHELTVEAPSAPLQVEVDVGRITQVVTNLLTNAIRYTAPRGRIVVTVRQEGGAAVVRVQDNGIGIEPAMLERIFEAFTQVARREKSSAGLGIGLTLVRSLVELHDGRITAASEGLGRGSTFTVHLPLGTPAPAAPTAAAEEATAYPVDGRILVVDDNEDARTTLALLLHAIGVREVLTAHDGAAGLDAARARRPAVMIVDLRMPNVDGFEVARRVREEPWGRDVLLVALSGWGEARHRDEARAAGFDHYLTKPAELEALRRILVEHAAGGGSAPDAHRPGGFS